MKPTIGILFTGLPASGKKTLGQIVSKYYQNYKIVSSTDLLLRAADRRKILENFSANINLEVLLLCSFQECERRDQSGKYKQARLYKRKYPGYFERSNHPDLILNTEEYTVNQCTDMLISYIDKKIRQFEFSNRH